MLDILGKKKHRHAPRIKVHIHHNADDSFITTAQATPDTGAEATVAGLDILKQIGIDIGNTCHTPEDTIIAANGTSFECVGTVDLHIHAADKSMKETVLICKAQKGLLLAWYVCRELGIVPNDYPKPIHAITRSSVIKSPGKNATENETSGGRTRKRYDLLEEFKDVFDTNHQLKTMSGEPMQIHLNENVETFAISTTRSIPLAWRDEVKANLDQMTRQGIVKPLGDVPTRWCHPLVIVPKPRGAYVFVWTSHVSTNSFVDQFIL